jgi:ABC-type multidrug transport system ATPase subunit
MFSLLGDNGSGKSTLVRQLVGLVRPDAGTVEVFGRDILSGRVDIGMHVGYLPQSTFALGHLTVAEAIYYTAHLRGMRRREALAHRDELLRWCTLDEFAGTLTRRLSGGYRRLTQLALAMAGRPPALVLDEPTNDLDPEHRKLVWQICNRLMHQRGTTIVLVTHDVAEVERIVDRVGLLHEGQLIAIGRPADLRRRLDQSLRLEITRLDGMPAPLTGLPPWRSELGRWVVWLRPEQVESAITQLAPTDLADIHLQALNLEDLALRFATVAQGFGTSS